MNIYSVTDPLHFVKKCTSRVSLTQQARRRTVKAGSGYLNKIRVLLPRCNIIVYLTTRAVEKTGLSLDCFIKFRDLRRPIE